MRQINYEISFTHAKYALAFVLQIHPMCSPFCIVVCVVLFAACLFIIHYDYIRDTAEYGPRCCFRSVAKRCAESQFRRQNSDQRAYEQAQELRRRRYKLSRLKLYPWKCFCTFRNVNLPVAVSRAKSRITFCVPWLNYNPCVIILTDAPSVQRYSNLDAGTATLLDGVWDIGSRRIDQRYQADETESTQWKVDVFRVECIAQWEVFIGQREIGETKDALAEATEVIVGRLESVSLTFVHFLNFTV